MQSWQEYREHTLQFIRGERGSSLTHAGPLTEDWGATGRAALEDLNVRLAWISTDGQPAVDARPMRSPVDGRAYLETQRSYLDAYVPTEQLAPLLAWLADRDFRASLGYLSHPVNGDGFDWLTSYSPIDDPDGEPDVCTRMWASDCDNQYREDAPVGALREPWRYVMVRVWSTNPATDVTLELSRGFLRGASEQSSCSQSLERRPGARVLPMA